MANLVFRLARRRFLQFSRSEEWSLLTAAAIIGLVMGAVATAFILPLHWVEAHASRIPSSLLLFVIPLAPMLGALLAGLVLYAGKPRSARGAPGVAAVMEAVHRKRSQLHWLVAPRKWLASTFTIASGGSAGAEGPIATIGAVIGSNLANLFGSRSEHAATLLGCGAAAGIASVFNAPLAGVFFVLEVLLRDFSLRTFTPIVIASVISAAFTHSLLGNDPLFASAQAFNISAFHAVEIPAYLLLGLLLGLLAIAFIRFLSLLEDAFHRITIHPVLLPVLGAALVGLLGLAFFIFNPNKHLPEFFGNGYSVIKRLIDPAFYSQLASQSQPQNLFSPSLLAFLLLLVAVKLLATCLTIGSGGSGGLFAPSLFIGAAAGGAFGCALDALHWFPSASPAHYAVVGMAAMIAATTHAPFTGIMIVYEITRSYEIILPLMFASVIAAITARVIYPDSIYTVRLTQMGIHLGDTGDLSILRRLLVRDIDLIPAATVKHSDSAQKLLALTEQSPAADFVVLDDHNNYAGMVTANDLTAALVYREAIPLLQVKDLQRSSLPTLAPDETLDVALDKFSRNDADALAVLDPTLGNALMGLLTRHRLLCHYHARLSRR